MPPSILLLIIIASEGAMTEAEVLSSLGPSPSRPVALANTSLFK